ncbi:CXADR-like membrane protein [Cyprinus carpio]|uniref:CXADR-like membrane protein n=1 Tax=Cyprinus carpio TaxID=7962 RepID=A0A9R0ANM2_CYPCA|nr:CXADR-like membrane protein [Cyprinus carpio]
MPQAFFSKVSLISVSLDVTVEGFIGGSVVLPCSSTEHNLKLQEVDVSWRHNGSKNVCDLIPRSNLMRHYRTHDTKNRTKTFPEGYVRGNFSIKLSGLNHADAGEYICLITPSDEQETVELIINDFFVVEPTTEKGNQTTDQEIQEEIRPDSVKKSYHKKSWLLILVVTLINLPTPRATNVGPGEPQS